MNNLVSFRKVVSDLLPYWKRTTNFLDYLYSIIKPVQDLNSNDTIGVSWNTFATGIKNFMLYNSQNIYLTKYLNDNFDNTLRRIYITTKSTYKNYIFNLGETATIFYLFNLVEGGSPIYFYNNNDGSMNTDFTIFIPAALSGSINISDITSRVNKYKISGKSFQITYF